MNKIKLKLSGDQCGILTGLIQEFETDGDGELNRLIDDLMLEILEKVHGRSLWMDKKNTINLTAAQGRAFNIFFSVFPLTGYELNLIRLLMADIDKQLNNGIRGPQNKTQGFKRLA